MSSTTSTETVAPVAPAETADKTDTTATSQETTSETEGNETPPVAKPEEVVLPDTHPLVKTLAAQKEELRTLKASAEQSKDKTTADLATATAELTSTKDELTAIQAKYTRLEEFLTKLGGPLSRALDSKSFTTSLFETDTDVAELVTQWHRDNPSATRTALGGTSSEPGKGNSINELLRAAIK